MNEMDYIIESLDWLSYADFCEVVVTLMKRVA